MNEELKNEFLKADIEYFSVIKYSDCHEINPGFFRNKDIEPKSVILYLAPYFVSRPKNFSAYAASIDYHLILKSISEELISFLKKSFPNNSFLGCTDNSPIDERHAALISGLGILGDNGLLINEKYGSYVFVGDILTDAEPDLLFALEPKEIGYCEHCGKCKAACPTAILSGKSTECLSAITQKKGDLSTSEIDLMKKCNTVWGCDLCQNACPHNASPQKTPISMFYEDRIDLLTSETVQKMSDEDFSIRAFAWRKRKTVMRNLKYLDY